MQSRDSDVRRVHCLRWRCKRNFDEPGTSRGKWTGTAVLPAEAGVVEKAEKNKRKQQENFHQKLLDFTKLKEFLNMTLYPDFDQNPKILTFNQRNQKKKELEQTLIERQILLEKAQKKLAIATKKHEATKKAHEEKIRNNEIKKPVELFANYSKYEIQNSLEQEGKNNENLSKIF